MGKVRKICTLLCACMLFVALSGCSLVSKAKDDITSELGAKMVQNYSDETGAKSKIVELLNTKYSLKFAIIGDEKYTLNGDNTTFSCTVKDSTHNLTATASLPQMGKEKDKYKSLKDDYTTSYYYQETYDAVNPLFKGEPFTQYFIQLDAGTYFPDELGLSVTDFFAQSGANYWFTIILPHQANAKAYADIIYPFYQKLLEQKNSFFFLVYSDNMEIYTVRHVDMKGYIDNSYNDVLDGVQIGIGEDITAGQWEPQPMPDIKLFETKLYG